MKSLVRSALVAAASALAPISVSAQFLIIDLGSLELEPNLSGQVHDFVVQNTGPSSVDSIFGMNFALQIGDGTSGPKVESVSLDAGNSIFTAHGVNQVDQGSSSWISFWGIDSGGVALSIPASSSTLLARLTLDTTGIGPGAGPWTVSANNVGPLNSDTEYVLVGGAARPIETFVSGELTVVPEPNAWGLAMGALMIGAVAIRKWTNRIRMPLAIAASPGAELRATRAWADPRVPGRNQRLERLNSL